MFRPTVRYWMEVEVHVYGFSIAANVLLSFFPFLIVMVSLFRAAGWSAAESAVYFTLLDYFPGELGDFVQRNLKVAVARRGPFQFVSMLLLLFAANGIFEPLEVALNRAWGIAKNRSYLKNQLVSLGLIFACGSLALLSVVLTALNRQFLAGLDGRTGYFLGLMGTAFFKMAALPITIAALFLVYWLLPNCKIRAVQVVPAAIAVGLALEAVKYLNLIVWPWLRIKLQREYGPFVYSATIVLWSFAASMIVLAGAEWMARSRIPESPADAA